MPPRAAAVKNDECLTEQELAAELKLSVEAVRQWRKQGRGPDYLKVEGRQGTVRYPRAWIDEWKQSRRVRQLAS